MSEWKPGDEAIIADTDWREDFRGLRVVLDSPYTIGTFRARLPNGTGCIVWGVNLRPVPAPGVVPEPVIGRPHDGQANTSGLRIEPAPKPDTFEPVMVGILRWVAINPRHRRAVVELQGDLIIARAWSLPSMIEAKVTFTGPDTAEGTVLTLDRAFTFRADYPFRFDEESQ